MGGLIGRGERKRERDRRTKSQKPGRALGGCITPVIFGQQRRRLVRVRGGSLPLNVRERENKSVQTCPAVSASGRAAISMWANVDANTKNWMHSRSTKHCLPDA